jgi:hypothetical protein
VLVAAVAIAGTGLAPGIGSGNISVAHADTPQLSGTYYANDNGVYYVQQNSNQVWWLGESVDKDHINFDPSQGLLGPNHVWNRGLVSTSVFQGTLSGSTLTGNWVEVSRGSSLNTGTMTLSVNIVTDALGSHEHFTLASGTAPDGASDWLQGDQLNDQFYQYNNGTAAIVDFYNRFALTKKSLQASGADCGCGDSLGSTNNPDELRPYRDQTVFYGMLEQTGVDAEDNIINAEAPHYNLATDTENEFTYPQFACVANDGDLDLRMRVDSTSLTTDYLSGTGWGNSNRADEADSSPPGSDYVDVVPKLSSVGPFNPGYHLGIEGIMYGGNNVGTGGTDPSDQKCPSREQVDTLLPGWADQDGNSILINGMPINGEQHPENLMVANGDSNRIGLADSQHALAGLNGITWTAAPPPIQPVAPFSGPVTACVASIFYFQYPCNLDPSQPQPLAANAGTEIRVTGALILDCGHADPDDLDTAYGSSAHNCDQGEAYSDVDDQNQEIHPLYSIDIIKCPLGYAQGYCPSDKNTARPNLTGAWGSNDGGTYYMRQVGNDIWWAGLTRNRDPIMPTDTSRVPTPIANPTNVFHGTITHNADGTATISGNAILVPKGQNSGGDPTTATFTVGADRKTMDLVSSSSSTFPWPTHFDKLYEPPGTTPPASTLTVGDPHYTVTLPHTVPPRHLDYVKSTTPLTIAASGGSGGVQNLWYRIYPDGSTPPAYTPVAGSSAAVYATGSDGLYDVDMYATDNSGNDEESHSVEVYLDNTGPTITITTPANGTAYTVGQSLTASYGCTDAGSGLATCVGPVSSGSPLSTSSPGSFKFTVNATDNLENASMSTSSYTVSYRICLLYDPKKALGTSNSTVSLRLQLCNAAGANLSSPAIVVTAVNVDGTGPPTFSGSANAGNLFRYDPTIAGYVYNLSTKGVSSGSHVLNFLVQGDPNGHGAGFVVK